jgi:CysZ protein
VGFGKGLAMGLRSALRALAWNLLASPLYLLLLFTAIGLPVALVLVNGLLLGRDLEAMVAARHPGAVEPLSARDRNLLGFATAVLFVIPIANLFAPVFGAALAVHMVHGRKDGLS